jgi:hypothetical protein
MSFCASHAHRAHVPHARSLLEVALFHVDFPSESTHGQLNENIAGASTGEMQTSLCFFSFFVLERRRRMQIAKASAGSMTNEKGTNFRWQKPRKCLQHAKQAASAAASTFPHGRARS